MLRENSEVRHAESRDATKHAEVVAPATEADEWASTKKLVEARAQARATSDKQQSPADAVLYALDQLAQKAAEAEEHVERSDRLAKVLGEEGAAAMKKRARRNSKELQDKMTTLLASNLEQAFKQFDLDGSGTLDAEELSAAYTSAGMPMAPGNLKRAMKLLDTNGDGVIDLEEFKAIAVKVKMMNAL